MKISNFHRSPSFAASGQEGPANAQSTEVSKSTRIDHPAEKVWALIGEYGELDKWHPAVVELELSGNGGTGIHRNLTLPDGALLKEKLLTYSLPDMSYSYSIISGPLPVRNYVSTISVRAGDSTDQCIVEWTSIFEADGVETEEAQKIVGGIYIAGFDGIADKLS